MVEALETTATISTAAKTTRLESHGAVAKWEKGTLPFVPVT